MPAPSETVNNRDALVGDAYGIPDSSMIGTVCTLKHVRDPGPTYSTYMLDLPVLPRQNNAAHQPCFFTTGADRFVERGLGE